MLVGVCQWRAAIGLFCSSVYMNKRVSSNTSNLQIIHALLGLHFYIDPDFTFLYYCACDLQANIQSKFLFLHTFVEMCILIKLIICTTFKSIKRIFSFILYFLYPHRKWSRCVFLIYLTRYSLHLQWLIFKHILINADIEKIPALIRVCLNFVHGT